ncbi:hypothetical protein [Piscirickettsia salmonis]|uniref:hypothetical protein n=1 Tax=Piscirickettsia salmonis TaxID=1238 RepID=UPI0012B76CCB|nr:hypothetical protein [Piscirickettsia salmonis]QHS25693.1 hypothetical protein GW538_06765 [Piscirickettsia salmonis]
MIASAKSTGSNTSYKGKYIVLTPPTSGVLDSTPTATSSEAMLTPALITPASNPIPGSNSRPFGGIYTPISLPYYQDYQARAAAQVQAENAYAELIEKNPALKSNNSDPNLPPTPTAESNSRPFGGIHTPTPALALPKPYYQRTVLAQAEAHEAEAYSNLLLERSTVESNNNSPSPVP